MRTDRTEGDGSVGPDPSPGLREWRTALEVVLRRSVRRGGFTMPACGLSAVLSEWVGRYAEHPSVTRTMFLRLVVRRLVAHQDGN